MGRSEWKTCRLGDLCVKIGSGATPRGGKQAYLEEGLFTLVRSQNVLDFFCSTEGLAHISEEQANQLSSAELRARDVLLNITGDSVARVCQVPANFLPGCVNQHVCIIRPDESVLIPEYLKYYLLNPSFKNYMLSLASVGGTRNALTKGMIEDFEIEVPPISIQQRIADILTILDEKIDLNRQTNATLEAIAQAIFKEWFVNFNFPGATGEMQDSELGPIPKGWQIGNISDLVVLSNETITPCSNPENTYYHFSIPSFDSGRVPSTEKGVSILSNKFRVKSHSILVSKLNPRIPRIWGVAEVDENRSICSTEFQVLLPQKEHFYSYILNMFTQSSVMETMKSGASGTSSSHQRIKPQDILDITVVIPEDSILKTYESIVGEGYKYALKTIAQSVNLAQLRDSLLPKLMSGDIAV